MVGYGDVAALHLRQIDEADELLTKDPLALLVAMVLDQRISEGWSGIAPSVCTRLRGAEGGFDATTKSPH